MKFTIIIPAYNSSTFINIPLNSLERQTYKSDFEVLIINDGSTDNLKEKIKPYIQRNKNWKLINKENGNWGSVINYVKHNNLINGQYVTILDSDDYFKTNMLEEVNKFNSDIIITGIAKKEKNKEKKIPIFFSKRNKIINKERAFTPISTPHGKFYKKQLFMKMIDLKAKVSYQDTVLFNDLVSKSESIQYVNKVLAVWWRDRDGNSTTQSWDVKRATVWLKTCQRISSLPFAHIEANAWVLMYLWELSRKYKDKIPFKIHVDTKRVKFKWLPFGIRNILKIYFLIKTKHFRNS